MPTVLLINLFSNFQIARAMGASVVGTAGTKDGMDVVLKCGAHQVS